MTDDPKPVAYCNLADFVRTTSVMTFKERDPLYTRATLDAAVAQARRDALEEAARVCEGLDEYAYADECPAAIRALADKPAGKG